MTNQQRNIRKLRKKFQYIFKSLQQIISSQEFIIRDYLAVILHLILFLFRPWATRKRNQANWKWFKITDWTNLLLSNRPSLKKRKFWWQDRYKELTLNWDDYETTVPFWRTLILRLFHITNQKCSSSIPMFQNCRHSDPVRLLVSVKAESFILKYWFQFSTWPILYKWTGFHLPIIP